MQTNLPNHSNESLEASLIICTFNRAESLRTILDSVSRQSYPTSKYEIIIVNDGSKDHTDSVCKEYSNTMPNLVYHAFPENRSKSVAVFYGISQAKTNKLLFTDDDCVLDPDWIGCIVQELDQHPLVAGRIKTTSRPYLMLCQNISEFHQFMGNHPVGNNNFIAGANMGIRKEVFEKIGEFSPIKTSFDSNISLRARKHGYNIYYSPAPVIYHYPNVKSLINMWKYESKRSSTTIRLRIEYQEILHTPVILRSSLLLLISSTLIAIGRTLQIFWKNPVYKLIHASPVVLFLKFAWCWGAFRGLLSMRK
jgi:glycosyltransferase involved in cell wall biosynthesis